MKLLPPANQWNPRHNPDQGNGSFVSQSKNCRKLQRKTRRRHKRLSGFLVQQSIYIRPNKIVISKLEPSLFSVSPFLLLHLGNPLQDMTLDISTWLAGVRCRPAFVPPCDAPSQLPFPPWLMRPCSAGPELMTVSSKAHPKLQRYPKQRPLVQKVIE